MQFMYGTGKRFGLGPTAPASTRASMRALPPKPARRTSTSAWAELNRSIELALAAYNGGEGRALRVYKGSGRGFWDAPVYNQFPPETRDYVPMVIAAAWLFLHPQAYGLTFPKVDAKPARCARAPGSIYELTICLGNGGDARWLHARAAQPQPALRRRQLAARRRDAQRDDQDRRPLRPPLHAGARADLARSW
jgi:membrane-bound lytic murein transglycosylase D